MKTFASMVTGTMSYFFGRYVMVPIIHGTEFAIEKVVMVAVTQFFVGLMWFIAYHWATAERGR